MPKKLQRGDVVVIHQPCKLSFGNIGIVMSGWLSGWVMVADDKEGLWYSPFKRKYLEVIDNNPRLLKKRK